MRYSKDPYIQSLKEEIADLRLAVKACEEVIQSASELVAQVPPSVAARNQEILMDDITKAREAIAKAKGAAQ